MNLEDFLPRVNRTVDAIAENTAIDYLRDATRQFARDTGVWKETLGVRDIISPQVETDLVLAVPSLDHDAWASGEEYDTGNGVERAGTYYVANRDHTSTASGEDGPPDDDDATAWDEEQRFEVPAEGTIYEISTVELDGRETRLPYGYDRRTGELTIRPSLVSVVRNGVRRGGGAVIESGELTVKATLQPTRTTDIVPNIFGDWDTAITSRALYEILNIPNKEWSNASAAARFRTRYREQLGEAKGDIAREGTTRPIRTTHRVFG